jgi:hypothetical protein
VDEAGAVGAASPRPALSNTWSTSSQERGRALNHSRTVLPSMKSMAMKMPSSADPSSRREVPRGMQRRGFDGDIEESIRRARYDGAASVAGVEALFDMLRRIESSLDELHDLLVGEA